MKYFAYAGKHIKVLERHLIGRSLIALLFVLTFPLPRLAQAAGTTPGAGSILQQVEPKPAPTPSRTEPRVNAPPTRQAAPVAGAAFEVKSIRIIGNTLFDTAALHALVVDGEGKKQTLGQLRSLASRITQYYRSHGYSLTRTIIPAQTIKDGVVKFKVIEARFDKITLENHSRVRSSLLQSTLSSLHQGQIIADRRLNRAMLLLSDLPGASASATVKPGGTVGTSNLNVNVAATPRLRGRLSLDNYGGKYTGRVRGGLGVVLANPLHWGDELRVNALTAGHGLDYGRLGYDSVINGYGTRLGAAYSYLHYILGGDLSSLNGYGTARVASATARQPLFRGRQRNLYLELKYANKKLRDHIDASGIHNDRSLGIWELGLSGDMHDSLFGGGINAWRLSWSRGKVAFNDQFAALADAATARTAGTSAKWNLGYTRLQRLTGQYSLYIRVSGQWANGNLDSAEKMSVGGPQSVRAYDMGIVSADSGYLVSVELHRALGPRWRASLFFDSAHVTINKDPWVTGENSASLSGLGVGLDWRALQHWHAKAYLAGRVGAVPSVIGSASSVRGWLQITRTF